MIINLKQILSFSTPMELSKGTQVNKIVKIRIHFYNKMIKLCENA